MTCQKIFFWMKFLVFVWNERDKKFFNFLNGVYDSLVNDDALKWNRNLGNINFTGIKLLLKVMKKINIKKFKYNIKNIWIIYER